MSGFSLLVKEIAECKICSEQLPCMPRPILQINPKAKILIAGQAPGKKAHNSGTPFDDLSGERLRKWLGISYETFYDPEQVAILPMGFCFPGTGKSGDLPPRKECADTWHKKVLHHLNQIELTIVIGRYAQQYYFGKAAHSVTELVASWQNYYPTTIPLPHPSPRNNIWIRKNPWFEIELLPTLKQRVNECLAQ